MMTDELFFIVVPYERESVGCDVEVGFGFFVCRLQLLMYDVAGYYGRSMLSVVKVTITVVVVIYFSCPSLFDL